MYKEIGVRTPFLTTFHNHLTMSFEDEQESSPGKGAQELVLPDYRAHDRSPT
jgi:hypothetical protein